MPLGARYYVSTTACTTVTPCSAHPSPPDTNRADHCLGGAADQKRKDRQALRRGLLGDLAGWQHAPQQHMPTTSAAVASRASVLSFMQLCGFQFQDLN